MCNKNDSDLEIILGMVSLMGTDKGSDKCQGKCKIDDKKECKCSNGFIKFLRNYFENEGYQVEIIKVTELLMKKTNLRTCKNLPKSLQYFLKMQVCSDLRNGNGTETEDKSEKNKGVILHPVLDEIIKRRSQRERVNLPENKEKKVVYIIDQLKNTAEYRILSHIYGLNYIQVSLFSSYAIRNDRLEKNFIGEGVLIDKFIQEEKEIKIEFNQNSVFSGKSITISLSQYAKEILQDASSALIKKDFSELTPNFKENETGQEVSKLFHKSHYFFNVDVHENELEAEVKKFVELIQGKHKQYPTQDEFGMYLASVAKFRSNFPGDRQIGAAILSEYGEVISVASIRAPSASANTTYEDQVNVQSGYNEIYKEVNEWIQYLSDSVMESEPCNKKKHAITKLQQFIKNSLDYHPCTHSEITAILDAAKLGVSVRNAILYTTTFPCHICAKDIISAGIQKVVYLEAYPKSRNSALYPKLILFDNAINSSTNGVPFKCYVGISPKRFAYVYDLSNKPSNSTEKNLPP